MASNQVEQGKSLTHVISAYKPIILRVYSFDEYFLVTPVADTGRIQQRPAQCHGYRLKGWVNHSLTENLVGSRGREAGNYALRHPLRPCMFYRVQQP